MVSDKKIFMGISHRVLCYIKFSCGGHLGRKSEMPNTIFEGDHPRIISAKFGWDWLSSFRGEDLFLAWWPSWLEVWIIGRKFGRGPSKDYFTKVWLQLAQWFLRRKCLCEFPIGSYVKLSSAVVAILVSALKCRTQFWKRTTQESSQQSLVEIGSVVSEEKIFFYFHPPFCPICIIGQNRQKFKVYKKYCNIC
jgi:hypothetical protein